MLHVDRHGLDPTVASSGLRVLIDHRAHHRSGLLLQAMYFEPETFPAERGTSLIHAQPTYIRHGRAAPRYVSGSSPVKLEEEVGEEVLDRISDVAQHRCLRLGVYGRPRRTSPR